MTHSADTKDSVEAITDEERAQYPWYDLEGALDDMTRTGVADEVCLRTVKRGCDNIYKYELALTAAQARIETLEADLQDAVGALRLLVTAKAIKNAGDTGDAYQQAKAEGWKGAFRIVNEQETKERDRTALKGGEG